MSLFIAIAGNMGVGKSTLTERLVEHLQARPFFEPVSDNPYLSDFYQDMPRWAFHSQLFFLSRRLQDHAQIMTDTGRIIQDRSLYENAEVFAQTLYERGQIQERDWQMYQDLYQTAIKLLRPPHIVIYLQASVASLVARIKQRGREFERSIDVDYLTHLNQRYNAWAAAFSRAPLITVSTDDMLYLNDPQAWNRLVAMIDEKLGDHQLKLF